MQERADLGVAFDGDADRSLFVDGDGSFVDGDATLWALATHLQAHGRLEGQRRGRHRDEQHRPRNRSSFRGD